jgi:exonuclease III
MYRHKNKPYHIDYCFVSADFAKKINDVRIGAYEEWAEYSDHTPLIVTFNL